MKKTFDFLIAGSGFGGSILAMCLARSGFEVCLVEKGSHPRFAIGESSTPIADMILRDLASLYDLPVLKEISRYGEWQNHHPSIVCGLKRGFSYYPHTPGKEFESERTQINELLVAASMDDENSDTNWLRSEVDSFLVQQVKKLGIDYLEKTKVTNLRRNGGLWEVELTGGKKSEKQSCKVEWIIDATGSPAFSETFFGTRSSATGFHTNSSAIYSHFEGVGRWFDYLNKNGINTDDYPYNPDHSALHQLIDEGWIWMLRFNNDLLSAGIVMDNSDSHTAEVNPPEIVWNQVITKYPSVKKLLVDAKLATFPGKMLKTGRLQRKLNKTYGEGWVALNHTAAFVDPLHSTGIAHTLSGIEKLAGLFSSSKDEVILNSSLENLEHQLFSELELIDLMVSSCYLTRNRFELFTAAVMLYFAATIAYEQDRLSGVMPDAFLCADQTILVSPMKNFHGKFREIRNKGYVSARETEQLIHEIRDSIEPYNHAGLMDPEKKNRYTHTAVGL